MRALVVGVVLLAAFAFFFVFPLHEPKPNDLPVLVVGEGAAAGDAARSLARREGRFDVRRVRSERAARRLILDRDAYGALVPGRPPRLLVATAASAPVAEVLPRAAGVPPARVTELRALAEEDRTGSVLSIVLVAMIVPAILGAVLLQGMAPGLDVAGRIGVLGLIAVAGGLVVMLIERELIEVFRGSFLALAGVLALGILAVSVPSAAFLRLFGASGAAVSFLLFLMLANPAAGAATAPELLPSPWSWAGQLLPPGATGTGLRNTAYFDAADASKWLVVLAAWLVAGAVLLVVADRRAARAGGGEEDEAAAAVRLRRRGARPAGPTPEPVAVEETAATPEPEPAPEPEPTPEPVEEPAAAAREPEPVPPTVGTRRQGGVVGRLSSRLRR